MFFVLSKILYYLLMPSLWIVGVFVYSFITKIEKRRRRARIATLVMLLVFTNYFMANEFARWWEPAPVPMKEVSPHEWGIILTGVTNLERQDISDRVSFHKGADRVTLALDLYRKGKIKKIFISGGSGRVLEPRVKEAPQLREVLIQCGVPPEVIFMEDSSKNTRENALYTQAYFAKKNIAGKPLLITSAFHMPRAQACFRKAGMETDAFPVDYYSVDRRITPEFWLMPSEKGMFIWSFLFHEWMGYIMYKMMGYC